MNALADTVQPKRKKQSSNGIVVNHLAKSVTERWLRSAFSSYGEIKSMYLQEGQTENCAFINFNSFEDAATAVKGMNGQIVDGLDIQVKLQEATGCETYQSGSSSTNTTGGALATTGPITSFKDTTIMLPEIDITGRKQYTLKVTNISKETTEEKLKSEFGRFKGLLNLKLNVTNTTFNYAWVNFVDLDGAKAAQQSLNGGSIDGSKIKLSLKVQESVASAVPQLQPNPSNSSGSAQVRSTTMVSSAFTFSLPKALNSQPRTVSTIPALSKPSIFPIQNQFRIDVKLKPKCDRESGKFQLQHLMNPIPPKDPVQCHPPAKPQESIGHDAVNDAQFLKVSQGDTVATTAATVVVKQLSQPQPQKDSFQSPFSKTLSHHTPKPYCSKKVIRKEPFQEIALSDKIFEFTQKSAVSLPATSANTVENMGVKQPIRPQFQNPFLAALPQHTPELSPGNQPPKSHGDTEAIEKHLPTRREANVSEKIVQKALQLPNSLIAKILVSSPKFKAKLQRIATVFKISVNGLDQSGTSICLMGLQKQLHQAEREVSVIAKQIKLSICTQKFPLHCMHLPTFMTAVESIHDIETRHLVAFSVVTSLGNTLEVKAFAEQVQKASTDNAPLQIAQLSSHEFLSTCAQEYSWFAQDNDGEYKPVHPAVNNILNKLQLDSCHVSESFKHDGTEYTVNLSAQSLLLTEKSTGFIRKIYRDQKIPIWSYYKDNDFGYVPYQQEECKTIEKLYQQGSPAVIEIKGQECTFNFEKMIQVDLEGYSPVPVVRDPQHLGPPKYELTLQVRGLEENLFPAKQELECMLSSSEHIISVNCELPPQHSPALPILLSNTVRQYCVKAQIHRPEGAQQIQLTIEGARANDYTDKVKVCIMKQSLDFQQKMIHLPRFPPEWEPQSKLRELKLVSEGSSEWNDILQLMKKSMPTVQIKRMERIQCRDLWKRYCSFKEEMDKKNKRKSNEKLLFHGTRNTDPKDIFKSEKGFDFRYSSDGLWGRGTYFAVKGGYSDQSYAYTGGLDGLKQLILAKVLTGESIKLSTDRTLTKPPPKPRRTSLDEEDVVTNELYDSVTGFTNGSQVYVVYDHEKSYPAYLLTYAV